MQKSIDLRAVFIYNYLMTRANTIYLGWNNTSGRAALAVENHDIVILTFNKDSKVLTGKKAVEFRRQMAGLCECHCGIGKCAEYYNIIKDNPGETGPYNCIFDNFFNS